MSRIIDNQLLFIHVAKTGGTFVRESFNYQGVPNRESGIFEIEDHYSHHTCIQKHPNLAKLWSFGFVRIPSNWYVSRWKWAMETNFNKKIQFQPNAARHWMADVWSDNLNRFLCNVLLKCPGKATEYFNAMLNGVDMVYRYEELEGAMNLIYDRIERRFDSEFLSIHFKDTRRSYKDQKADPKLLRDILEKEPIAKQYYL